MRRSRPAWRSCSATVAWWMVGTQMLAAWARAFGVVEARIPKCEGPRAPGVVVDSEVFGEARKSSTEAKAGML